MLQSSNQRTITAITNSLDQRGLIIRPTKVSTSTAWHSRSGALEPACFAWKEPAQFPTCLSRTNPISSMSPEHSPGDVLKVCKMVQRSLKDLFPTGRNLVQRIQETDQQVRLPVCPDFGTPHSM